MLPKLPLNIQCSNQLSNLDSFIVENGKIYYMNKDERIQILISKDKKKKLETMAVKHGFDSITDFTRFLYNNLISGSFDFEVIFLKEAKAAKTAYIEKASPKLEKVIKAARKEYKEGKTIKLNSKKSIVQQLLA